MITNHYAKYIARQVAAPRSILTALSQDMMTEIVVNEVLFFCSWKVA